MIILISGPIGVGKDTVANYLVTKYNFKRVSFADSLKREVSDQYNIPLDHFYERELKDSILYESVTPRTLLIDYATKKRSKDIDYFVKHVVEEIDTDKIVIPDFRMFNEKDYFKSNYDQVITLWINREVTYIPDSTQITKCDCDYVINNDREPFDEEYIDQQLKEIIKF